MSYWRQPQQSYDQGYNNYGYGDRNMNNQSYGGGYGSYDRGYGGGAQGGYGHGGGGGQVGGNFNNRSSWNNNNSGYGGGSYRGGGYGGQRKNDDRHDGRKRNFRDQQGPKPKHRANPKMPKLQADYYFENDLRKVYPYFFTFFTTAQKRWEDRELLDVFTDEYPSNTRDNYKKAIEKGTILVNDQRVPLDYVVKNGDSVSSKAHRHEDPVLDLAIQIVHEDTDILVVNKPPGIPCNPSGRFKANAVLSILLHDLNLPYLKNMYHLDWQSSGLMVFGKNPRKFETLDHQVHHGMVKKQFVARVAGEFPLGKVTVDNPQESVSHKLSLWRISGNGKPSKTTFERISYNGKSSVVKCIPEVGRTSHQIRVHLQYMGHPIINDRVYNSEAWGENKGKGGVYERPMEEVIEELSNIHKVANVGDWLEDENPILTQKAAKEAEDQAKAEEQAREEEEALKVAKEKIEKDTQDAIEKRQAGEENMAEGETEGEGGTEVEGEKETENEVEPETEAEIEAEPAEVETADPEKTDADAEAEDEEVTAMDTSENSEPQAKRVKTDDEAEDETKGDNKEDDDTPKVAYSRYKTRGQIFVVKHKPFNIDKWSPAENCLECLRTYVDPKPEDLVLFLHAQMFESPDWQYYSKLPDWAKEDWTGPEED